MTKLIMFFEFAIFTYIMIVYSELNNKDQSQDYLEMINWISLVAITQIVFLCCTLIFLGIVLISKSPSILVVFIILHTIIGFIINIIYIQQGLSINRNILYICQHENYHSEKVVNMCNFYNTKFYPIFIMIIMVFCFNIVLKCINYMETGSIIDTR